MNRIQVSCSTPYCNNQMLINEGYSGEYSFCPECKEQHSKKVLKLQAEHGKTVQEAILDSRIFNTANGMADYLGVSFVTMYNWIRQYFGMSFQEFRRKYLCKSSKCYLLNIERSSYSRNDYILKKIRISGNYCACINSLESNYIMTNCPQSVVSSILRGRPKIAKISNTCFVLIPEPIKIFNIIPVKLEKFNLIEKTCQNI